MRNPIRRARLAWAALCWAVASAGACAQAVYPQHAVKLIVPWPAGGSVDIAARVIAEQLSVNLGQPVIVDNRPGAAGNIGATMAAQSAPDGYTLLMATTPMIINRSLYRNLPFDLARDFTPVSQLVTLSYVLVAHPSVAHSVPELIAKAKAQSRTTQLCILGARNATPPDRRRFQATGRHRHRSCALQGGAAGAGRHARRPCSFDVPGLSRGRAAAQVWSAQGARGGEQTPAGAAAQRSDIGPGGCAEP